MVDFRSDRMPSPDGRGNARKAWDAYMKGIDIAAGKIARPIARNMTFDLLGFWLAWHLEGGFEGLQRKETFGMSRSGIYRRIALFRLAMGKHPDEYMMPGVTLDLDAYWRAGHGPSEDVKDQTKG